MKFDELDAAMRLFETGNDRSVLPGIYIVARIDGRSFTRLTKEVHQFEAPFDIRFRDYMVATTEHLMDCGFPVVYGYTQSDEISLLFHRDISTFGRKVRKYNSILAAEASARFSILLGDHAAFDCRLCELPRIEYVRDYFRWRNEDAHRNALNSHCFWILRKEGKSVREADGMIHRLSVAQKNELLFQRGVNFNDIPLWQKRGTGLYWEIYQKQTQDFRTGEEQITQRRRIKTDYELPMRDNYGDFVMELVTATHVVV